MLVGCDDYSDWPEDLVADLPRVGKDLDVDLAKVVVLEPDLVLASPAVPAQVRPAVLVEWWPKPVIVPGRKSWVSDLLRLAGGRKPREEHDGESTPVTDAEVLAAAPDAVVACWCGVRPEKVRPEKVRARESWQALPALRHDRVHCIPEAYLGRPGPRLVHGYRALREVVAHARGDVG